MSVQVKKKFEELVTYLGKDTKGLEKVKQLKDAVNELRKKLAAAEEKLEQMEAVKDAARERADAAEAEKLVAEQQQLAIQVKLSSVSQELSQRKQFVSEQRQRETADMHRLHAMLSTTYVDAEVVATSAVLQRLQASMPTCVPATCAINAATGLLRLYDRQKLATGWSDDELWRVGAVVSLLSSHYGVIGLVRAGSKYVMPEEAAATRKQNLLGVELATRMVHWADTHDSYRKCDIDTLLDRISVKTVSGGDLIRERESQEVR